MEFTAKTFSLPELKGISAKSVEEHLKLYAGYVKHANLIIKETAANAGGTPEADYALAEMRRRFAFEFGGIRNHEIYFGSLVGGSTPADPNSTFAQAVASQWGSFEAWLAAFKKLAMTRGPGWAILTFDEESRHLLHSWVDEQHLGHLPGTTPVLALDMWEHSYVADYQPSGKAQYVEDFFANLNWKFVEERFAEAIRD